MMNDEPNGQAGWISAEQIRTFAEAGTNAYRLFTGREAWVERLGNDLLVSYKTESALERILWILDEWKETPVERVFGRFLARQNEERQAPILLRGDPEKSLETVVLEGGLSYGIDFAGGYSAGLFLDQRANRAFLGRAGRTKVLNTFAYTCSFSVVAALGGAKTVSIDLSKKSLTRGKANFALNQLSLEGHRFLVDDTLEVLPRMARKMETFDAIILDPPTFSRGAGGRRWQVEEHFGQLLHLALNVAAPGAMILLSTNCTKIDRAMLEDMAKGELRVAARKGKLQSTPILPDFPPGEGAQTLWLLLD